MTLAEVLPPVNAALNATSATLLVLAWRAIRRGDRERHRRLMLSALGTSALFLAGYLTRVALTGTHRFPGAGLLRAAYLLLLGTHTVLAAAIVPLVAVALWFAWKGRFESHRRVARFALPAWLYVSVTGVLVYVMLYWVAPLVGHGA
jgi:putative membrane protein